MRLLWSLLLTGVLVGPVSASDSMRCGSRLISTGARAAEIIATCGEPDYRDVWNYPQPYTGQWVSDIEQWYYNFGPNQLLRVLELRHGRLRRIDTDGYGFHESATRHCAPGDLLEGMSKYRLLQRCGDPVTREFRNLVRPWPPGSGRLGERPRYVEQVYREEWVYNFGPRYFMRVLTLENGRVTDVDNAGRGY